MQRLLDTHSLYAFKYSGLFFLHYNCSFILFFVSQALVLPINILQTLFCLQKQNQSCFHILKHFLAHQGKPEVNLCSILLR